VSIATVPAHSALQLTADRVIEILQTKLPVTLSNQYSRTNNDITDNGSGVFLPDPSEYYRQSSPAQEDVKGVTEVEVYTGQRASTDHADYGDAQNDGYFVEIDIPWAATVVFGVSLHQSVNDPVQSGDLSPREITQRRADLYSGALKHTLTKWGSIGSANQTRANAVRDVNPGDDLTNTFKVRVNDADETALRGIAIFEFTIEQFQKLPERDQT